MQRRGFRFFLLAALCGLLAISGVCMAQDSIPAEIRVENAGDSVHFSPLLRPLRQLAGAPSAFYTYFWELGDGRFSFEKEPYYAYRDTGTYQVRLFATNNYDDGKAPPTKPHPVKIRKKATGTNEWASHFFHGGGNIEMKINRNPRPGEDFVALIGYRNLLSDSLSGSIVLFFNEKQFGREGFALTEKRMYNGEDSSSLNNVLAGMPRGNASPEELAALDGSPGGFSPATWNDEGRSEEDAAADEYIHDHAAAYSNYYSETRSMLRSMQNVYSRHTVLHFSSIKKGEENFLFMNLNTLPGMIQDTNATVSMSAMLIPDNAAAAPELFELDMQVVASHDPNRMQLKRHRINYRFFKKRKELDYAIQFQNTGKGPARKIAIGVSIPKELNAASIQLKGMSPVCRWCDSVSGGRSCIDTFRRADSIYFVFDNIYLPGLGQDGVQDKDSTKGFLEYSIRFKRKPKKKPFSSRASIVFDKNEPVVTNKATARFIKGFSPGIMAGYNIFPSNGGYSATGPLQIGYVLAPYSPYRPYFQAEVSANVLQQEQTTGGVIKTQGDSAILGQLYQITGRQTITIFKRNSLELTPLHFRYNLSNWVGIGIGGTAEVNITEQTTTENKVYLLPVQLQGLATVAVTTTKSAVNWIPGWRAEPFADIQVGRVRTGPVIGLRYLRQLQGNTPNRFFLYAAVKL